MFNYVQRLKSFITEVNAFSLVALSLVVWQWEKKNGISDFCVSDCNKTVRLKLLGLGLTFFVETHIKSTASPKYNFLTDRKVVSRIKFGITTRAFMVIAVPVFTTYVLMEEFRLPCIANFNN